jgi:DnaJ family protein C protein 9
MISVQIFEKMETHVQSQLQEAFNTTDLYAIIGIDKATATTESINKAYRKLALKFHPDRKDGDAIKFKALSVAHSILSDESKRAVYDRTGDCELDEASDDEVFWYNYFRAMFPALTKQDIQNFHDKYIGSEEETKDVIHYYEEFEGNLSKMMECIIGAEEGEEARICGIIDGAIARKELKSTTKYQAARDSVGKGKKLKPRKSHAVGDDNPNDMDSLALRLMENRNKRASGLANLFAKFGGDEGEGMDGDISDEAFETTRRRLMEEKPKSKASGPRKKSKAK